MNRRLVLALALALAGCGKSASDAGTGPSNRYPVETAVAVSEQPQRSITVPAALTARETARIATRVSGVVDRVLVNEGDQVRRGQVVAEIDSDRYRLTVDGANAELKRARAVRDDATAAQSRRERVAREQPGLVSGEELAQVRARTAQADADVAASEARLARAELDLRDARVLSPLEGIVQSRDAATGDAVQPGSAIATVVDRSTVLLRCAVAVGDAAAVRSGSVLTFRIPGETADRHASVILVGETADPKTRQVEVVAKVDAADAAQTRPGAFAEARIDLPPGDKRILVPDLAVQPSEKGYLVWVALGAGEETKASERRVTVGSRTRDGRVEILAGIAVGDRVVVRGGEALREGSPLDLREAGAERK